GLETTYIKTASGQLIEQKEDILLSLITNKTVLQVFMAMLLVGIVLLIITTIVQMIRTEYTTEGSKNNKSTILGTALKAFAYFFIVPVACVFGIIVANYLLKAIDVATSAAGARTVAGSVFVAAANDANGVRQRTKTNQAIGVYKNLLDGASFNLKVQYHVDTNSYDSRLDNALFKPNDSGDPSTNSENAAVMIDNAFSQGSLLSVLGGGSPVWLNTDELGITDAEIKDTFWNGNTKNVWFSYDNPVAVLRYYNMADINYLILYVGLALCIFTLFKATFGMIKRMYKATMLFIISPGIIGIWPLDGGKAFQSWRTQFVSSVLSAYGVIVALNLYFVIVGAIDNIVLFDPKMNIKAVGAISGVLYVMMPPLITLVNATVRALMIIVGALMVSEMASTISSLIGAGDALKEGSEMTGKVAGAIGKGAMVAMGAGALAGKMAKGVGKGIGNIGYTGKDGKRHTFGGAIRAGAGGWTDKDGNKHGGIFKKADGSDRGVTKIGRKVGQFVGTGVAGAKFGIGTAINALTGNTRGQRINELKMKSRAGHMVGKENLTADEQSELASLTAETKAATAARNQRFAQLPGMFFKQSGMGKALNTMTAGTIEAFGGDTMSKAAKAASEKNPAYDDNAEIEKNLKTSAQKAKYASDISRANARKEHINEYGAKVDIQPVMANYLKNAETKFGAGQIQSLCDAIKKIKFDSSGNLDSSVTSADKDSWNAAAKAMGFSEISDWSKVNANNFAKDEAVIQAQGLSIAKASVEGGDTKIDAASISKVDAGIEKLNASLPEKIATIASSAADK
ncbi:MAG: hypothetical protein IK070_03455, partial [Clostridia bacterium]|nr:hypothetical protein [Clostridia bacterium]